MDERLSPVQALTTVGLYVIEDFRLNAARVARELGGRRAERRVRFPVGSLTAERHYVPLVTSVVVSRPMWPRLADYFGVPPDETINTLVRWVAAGFDPSPNEDTIVDALSVASGFSFATADAAAVQAIIELLTRCYPEVDWSSGAIALGTPIVGGHTFRMASHLLTSIEYKIDWTLPPWPAPS